MTSIMEQREETLIITLTNGIRHVAIQSTLPEKKKTVERLSVSVMATNIVNSIPPIQNVNKTGKEKVESLPITNGVSRVKLIRNVTETSNKETLNLTNSTLNNLDVNNLSTMVRKMMAIKIKSKSLIEDMVELIHQNALSQPNLTGEYAEMCAMMIGDHSFTTTLQALDVTVLQVLLPKCYDVFYSYKQPNERLSEIKKCYDLFYSNKRPNDKLSDVKKTTTLHTSSPEQNARLLANSLFIAELYNKGVLPTSILWSFMMDLARNDNNAQVYCLATILKSAGSRLSKTYSLASIVGHLLILENDSEREEAMCFDLRNIIHDVKIQHAKFWIHEEPDRAVKENMHRVNPNLIKPNKSPSIRTEYALNLMAHCALVDCWDLLSTFPYRKKLNEVSDFPLTPALSALIKTDQLDFIVHVGVIAVKETCPRIRENAGKLLAELVKAKLLSKLIVYLGFQKVSEDYAKDKNIPVLVLELESEFDRQLNDV